MNPQKNLASALRHRNIRRVLIVVMVLDVAMALAKGGYGYLTGSIAMVSDGLHSGLHAAGGVVGLAGVYLAGRPADASHPYGYERYEVIAAMGIAVLMLAAVWGIFDDAWMRFHTHEVARVTWLSFAIVSGCMLLGIWLGRYGRRGRREHWGARCSQPTRPGSGAIHWFPARC
jgi:cation diffusion facilitator family transporter